jgi:hypothetical protein
MHIDAAKAAQRGRFGGTVTDLAGGAQGAAVDRDGLGEMVPMTR